jgi:predicted 3-demethylubiquinone-9 3-methyltransferase (glyoxalase superfamily)
MQKISPFLWFDNQAEEAANFYVSIFKNSRILNISRYGDAGPGVPGAVMVVEFELEGELIRALNGGPEFGFTEAVSLYVDCESQEEVDYFWDRLLEGGEPSQCGWLKDRYGLSWQIIPRALTDMIADPDPEKANRAMRAMLEMQKIDVRTLEKAYAGG